MHRRLRTPRRSRTSRPGRWPRNHRPHRRPAGNRRRSRRSHRNRRLRPGLRHNPPRSRSSRRSRRGGGRSRGRSRRTHLRRRLRNRPRRRRRRHRRPCRRRRATRLGLSLLAFQNQPCRIARLRYMREVEGGLRLYLRLARRPTPAALVLEIPAHLLGLVGLNGTGVRLCLGHANRRESVQNGPALDFQLSCEIVDSNFAHPPLLSFPCALSCSYQPHRSRNPCHLYYP